jgi:hypothetical protein
MAELIDTGCDPSRDLVFVRMCDIVNIEAEQQRQEASRLVPVSARSVPPVRSITPSLPSADKKKKKHRDKNKTVEAEVVHARFETLGEALRMPLHVLVDPPHNYTWDDLVDIGANANHLFFYAWKDSLDKHVVAKLQLRWKDLFTKSMCKQMVLRMDKPFAWWYDVFGVNEEFIQRLFLREADWETLGWDEDEILALTRCTLGVHPTTGYIEYARTHIRR